MTTQQQTPEKPWDMTRCEYCNQPITERLAHLKSGCPNNHSVIDPAALEKYRDRPKREVLREWHELGMSRVVAMDYYQTLLGGWSQSEWADNRGVGNSAVSENVRIARSVLVGEV